MAWRFHAIDATLSPWPRRLDGVEAHEGPRNISQDNPTHWLISTQARGPTARTLERAFHRRVRDDGAADDEPLRHVRPAHAAVPRRRHHHGAGARSPLTDREALRPRSRTASPDPQPTLIPPGVPSPRGAPARRGPTPGPEPAYAGATPGPPAPPAPPSGESIAVAGPLDWRRPGRRPRRARPRPPGAGAGPRRRSPLLSD